MTRKDSPKIPATIPAITDFNRITVMVKRIIRGKFSNTKLTFKSIPMEMKNRLKNIS